MEVIDNKEVIRNLMYYLCNYETTIDLKYVYRNSIFIIYDLNRPKNISLLILSIFYYLNTLEKRIDNEFPTKINVENKYLYIYSFFIILFQVLNIEDDIDGNIKSCKSDIDYLKIISNETNSILNYFTMAKVNLMVTLKNKNTNDMEELLERLKNEAEKFINDNTLYNKIPNNFKKLYSKYIDRSF